MTIDIGLFEDTIIGLYDIFGKDIRPGSIKILYKAISKSLTQEEFIQGVEIAIQSCDYLPTVKQIIEAVKGSVEDQALIQLELYRKERFDQVEPIAKKAMDQLGGYMSFKTSQKPDLFRRDFVKAYSCLVKQSQRQGSKPQAGLLESSANMQRRLDNIKQRQSVGMTLDVEDLALLEQHRGLVHVA